MLARKNYLFEGGVRKFPHEVFWNCEPETRKGDLILVYRKSKKQLTVPLLMKHFGMSQETAIRVTKEDVGKDFPVIWEATSNSRRKLFWSWPYGCNVREFWKISPPNIPKATKLHKGEQLSDEGGQGRITC